MKTKPQHVVVKVYGVPNLLFALVNPLLTTFITNTRGANAPLMSEARVVEKAEQDAQRMADRGYRIVSSELCEWPLFRIPYVKVTYELVR